MIDPGLVVKTFGVGGACEFEQVSVSDFILGQQQEMEGMQLASFTLSFLATPLGDVGLDPDDRFDSFAAAGLVKFHCTEHVSMISQSQ